MTITPDGIRAAAEQGTTLVIYCKRKDRRTVMRWISTLYFGGWWCGACSREVKPDDDFHDLVEMQTT